MGVQIGSLVLAGNSRFQLRGSARLVKASQALVKPWPSLGQALVKPWSILGQALVQPWSSLGQALVKHWQNDGSHFITAVYGDLTPN